MTNPNRYFSLFEHGKQSGGGGRLRRAYRRRLAAASARGRSGEEVERLGEEVVQLVCALAGHGDLGRHQGFFLGRGGLGSVTDTAIPATSYPGELGIGTVVTRGGSGWRESTNGAPLAKNLSTAEAARENRSPELRCLSSYDWGRGELWGG